MLDLSFIVTFFFVFYILAVLLDFKMEIGLFYSKDASTIFYSSTIVFGFKSLSYKLILNC